MDAKLQQAIQMGRSLTQDPTPKGLTPEQKANWNKFIDYVGSHKMTGNPILDQRDKQVGLGLLAKYNMENPKNALPTDIVPKVQQDLQDYRTNLVKQWKSGKVQATPDVKSEADIMPTISKVDGWPGTLTLSHKFPVAQATITTPSGKATKDYGTDVGKFDKDKGIVSN